MKPPHSRVTVSLQRYLDNLALLSSLMPQGAHWQLCPVIKANAYGHGTGALAHAIDAHAETHTQRVGALGVVDNWEIGSARQHAHHRPVLRLRPFVPRELHAGPTEGVETIGSLRGALELNAAAARAGLKSVAAHLYIDMGMGRAGFHWAAEDDVLRLVESIQKQCPRVVLTGYMTHMPRADEDTEGTRVTAERFLGLVSSTLAHVGRDVRLAENQPLYVHYANSPTLVTLNATLPELPQATRARFGIVHLARPGIATYGPVPFGDAALGLRSVMTWEVDVCAVRTVPRGGNVGYGTCTLERDSVIATLPIGYADGYLRSLSGRGIVSILDYRVPVVGRVMMDMICVDITDHPWRDGIAPGTPAQLLGDAVDGNLVADRAGTIAYEVYLSVGRSARALGYQDRV